MLGKEANILQRACRHLWGQPLTHLPLVPLFCHFLYSVLSPSTGAFPRPSLFGSLSYLLSLCPSISLVFSLFLLLLFPVVCKGPFKGLGYCSVLGVGSGTEGLLGTPIL